MRLLFNHAHIVARSETRTPTHVAASVEPAGRPPLLLAAVFLAAAFGRRVVEDAPLDGVLQEAPLADVAPTPWAATPISSTNLTRQADDVICSIARIPMARAGHSTFNFLVIKKTAAFSSEVCALEDLSVESFSCRPSLTKRLLLL